VWWEPERKLNSKRETEMDAEEEEQKQGAGKKKE
jgi:hypothetical protein